MYSELTGYPPLPIHSTVDLAPISSTPWKELSLQSLMLGSCTMVNPLIIFLVLHYSLFLLHLALSILSFTYSAFCLFPLILFSCFITNYVLLYLLWTCLPNFWTFSKICSLVFNLCLCSCFISTYFVISIYLSISTC